ncbi:hypothetical protein [Desulfosporosinus shakirovi]|uniref:hypothetical protein n=1 Tax=Desulfosporosinus shakirovi TaxID=2885154 RepID=UPI001E2B0847|nr:hypothetical protein [Desulfosporosinus sp. SRJS8]MCB8817378.1 hypothetical protein [Desulfosporosinus sp. SRJS8]
MKSSAFYELDNVLKDTKNDKSSAFIEKYSVEEILFAFKVNGFGVNAYPRSESEKSNISLDLHKKVYAKALMQMKQQLIEEYDLEIKTWNVLFEDFYSKDQFEEVAKINDENKLYAFLIVFEVYMRSLNDRKFNNGKNKNSYNEVDILRNINGEIKGINNLTANQFTDAVDYTFQQASKVIQAFIFYGFLYKNNKFTFCSYDKEINSSDINQSMIHFPLIDIRTVLFDAFEDWKFGNYEILRHDETSIEIKPKDIKDLIQDKIELQRFESSRQTFMCDFNSPNKEEVYLSNLLAPNGYLDKREEASYNEYLEYFSSKSLDFKVDEIEIVKWLRAFAIVRYVNREFIDKVMFPESSKPDKWLYVSTIDEWVKRFVMYGIDKKSAKRICNRLKFKRNSIDWFDAPFIEIGEKIITVPSYASHIQDSLALMSLASKENFNLNFKGYCFEDRILTDLNENQIPAVSLKRNVNNEEYQCDVAFVLGEDMFLCECKHTVQPATPRKRYDFYNRKIPEDINQINRISDFYSSNIVYVLEELNKQKGCRYSTGWKPRRIYRMLLYSCKISGKFDPEGVIITDYTILATLLYKRLPTIYKNGEPIRQFIPPKMKGVFQGKLTTNKLLNFIKSPWQIGLQKAFTEVEDERVPINKIYLHRKKVFKTIDDFYAISK